MIRDLLSELSEKDAGQENIQENSTEAKLLELLRQNEKHSAKNLALEIGISERQVQRILRELKASGVIERVGSNRGGKWVVKWCRNKCRNKILCGKPSPFPGPEEKENQVLTDNSIELSLKCDMKTFCDKQVKSAGYI